MASIRDALQNALNDEATKIAERLDKEGLVAMIVGQNPQMEHHQRKAIKTACRRVLWEKHPALARELFRKESDDLCPCGLPWSQCAGDQCLAG